jgi:endo-1,4-beta-mannosidase
MFQAETFDPTTIDEELGYAAGLGFNTVRVFLHPILWQQDAEAFKKRLDTFLSIAESHKIKTMFAMFDDCWNAEAKLGTQPAPIQGVHNSQWVQSPGAKEYTDQSLFPTYEAYFNDIIGSFKDDDRILIWDIYNEPGNNGHGSTSLPLL